MLSLMKKSLNFILNNYFLGRRAKDLKNIFFGAGEVRKILIFIYFASSCELHRMVSEIISESVNCTAVLYQEDLLAADMKLS